MNEGGLSGVRASVIWWADDGAVMDGLVGAFVRVFIGVLLSQVDLVNSPQTEVARRQQAEACRMALEKALAIPMVSGFTDDRPATAEPPATAAAG